MPTACGQQAVLTGQDGMITMRPPNTFACLLDNSDFPVPVSPATFSVLPVGAGNDFRVGDPVSFEEKGVAQLDGSLSAGTVYYVKTKTNSGITISATPGGSAIAFDGDGGSGTADTPGAANHIEFAYAENSAMCEVVSATLNITRGEVDRTSIPCSPSAGANSLAKFRTYQPGFADGNGTLVLRLTPDDESFNNRILRGTMFSNQAGCVLKMYFNAVAGQGGGVDDIKSNYCELPITLLGFEGSLTNEDTPTQLTVNYRVSSQPSVLFGLAF